MSYEQKKFSGITVNISNFSLYKPRNFWVSGSSTSQLPGAISPTSGHRFRQDRPSPSQSRSAVVVAGNRHETGRFGQFLTEFRGARSPSSGHRFRRVSVDSSVYELGFSRFSGHCSGHFRPVFGAPGAASACGGAWAAGWGPQSVLE
ncbi:unnamed protein product [Prunus armeniaca]